MAKLFARALVVAALGGAPLAAVAQPDFSPLGFLDGTTRESYAWGVSGDGMIVVGESSSAQSGLLTEAFRRTAEGMVGLGSLVPENFLSVANAASMNGQVVVGFSRYGMTGTLFQAFRDPDGAISMSDGLGDLPTGALLSNALGVSANGSVVVGYGNVADAQGISRRQGFIYDAGTGQMRGLGVLAGDNSSTAYGVSADGTKIAGQSSAGISVRAALWTIGAGGAISLAELAAPMGGSGIAEAWGISGDGQVVVGDAESLSGLEACKWIGGMPILLGDLPGGDFSSSALAASADGSVIVGYGTSATSGFLGEAVFWDANGIHSLRDTLIAAGLDLTGWQLQVANAVSDDGRVIVGNGVNPAGRPEAWRVVLPPACPIDFNGDGEVNADDLSDYITCFFTEALFPGLCPAADFNGDGSANPDDLSDYITAFFGAPC